MQTLAMFSAHIPTVWKVLQRIAIRLQFKGASLTDNELIRAT